MFRGNWRPRRAWGGWSIHQWSYQPQGLCYATPERLARWMVELADLRPGMRVLEPQAGDGALADAVRAACPGAVLDVLEIEPALQAVLQQKGHRLVGDDALRYRPGPVYHRVLMNPPFTGLLDIWHILTAFDHLAYGGRLVAIAGDESARGASARSQAFQAWLREQQAWVQPLPGGPQGVFMESRRPTQVATCLIVVRKLAADSPAA